MSIITVKDIKIKQDNNQFDKLVFRKSVSFTIPVNAWNSVDDGNIMQAQINITNLEQLQGQPDIFIQIDPSYETYSSELQAITKAQIYQITYFQSGTTWYINIEGNGKNSVGDLMKPTIPIHCLCTIL